MIAAVHSKVEEKLVSFASKTEMLVADLDKTQTRHAQRIEALQSRRDQFISEKNTVNNNAYASHRTWLFPFIIVVIGLAYVGITGYRKYQHLVNFDSIWGGKTYKMT
eukprot:g1206.t1